MRETRWKAQVGVESYAGPIRGNNKGKSGGVRTITLFSGENLPVFLITAFGKGQKSNLTKGERNELKKISDRVVQEYSRRVLPIAVGE
jgi:hypothetical protein